MAKEKETKPTAEAAAPVAAQEPKFSVERLRQHCGTLFGVSSTTFAGATAELTGEYTVKEMAGIIAAWEKKEVR